MHRPVMVDYSGLINWRVQVNLSGRHTQTFMVEVLQCLIIVKSDTGLIPHRITYILILLCLKIKANKYITRVYIVVRRIKAVMLLEGHVVRTKSYL